MRKTLAVTAIAALVTFALGACSSIGDSHTGAGGSGQSCANDQDCPVGEICINGVCGVDPDFSGGVEEGEGEALGEINNGFGGADEPKEIGAVIDSFCGIDAYQNGSNVSAVAGNSAYGYQFQCTELAYRFVCQHYQLCEKKVGSYGNAKKWYGNYSDPVLKQLVRYENGGAEPPVPGDVIVWGGGKYGHVAIVKSVQDDFVQVLEQNNYKGTHTYALVSGNGTYSIKSALGWMRVPNAAPACGDGGANNPSQATLTSPAPGSSLTGPFSVSGSATDADALKKVTITLGTAGAPSVCDGDCNGTAQTINMNVDPAMYGIPSGAQIEIAVWVKDAMGNVAGPLAKRTVTWQGASSGVFCGDGMCNGSESQSTCCTDCGCPAGKSCQGGSCIDPSSCGDAVCNGNETQNTCCIDCGCPAGQMCQGNSCVANIFCGDAVCNGSETQSTCCTDCGCSNGQVCQGGSCSCPAGNYGQFSILNNVYNPNNPAGSFGPLGCSGDNTTKLKASAEMISPTKLRFHVRKADDTAFSSAATLSLYVGAGPTCPDPANVVKATQAVVVGAVDQIIDLTVPYPGWALGETKPFWVGKSEGGHAAWRATGVINVTRTCL